jgi:hypothetical protein
VFFNAGSVGSVLLGAGPGLNTGPGSGVSRQSFGIIGALLVAAKASEEIPKSTAAVAATATTRAERRAWDMTLSQH